MKKILTAILILVAISFFASTSFAEEEAGACDVAAAALCELCGEEFCAELAKQEEPEEAECVELLKGLEELATAAEELSEEEQEALGAALCVELVKAMAEE